LNPHNRHTRVHNFIARRLEEWAIGHCDKLILNTPGAELLYKRQYPQWQEKMLTIPNGYDRLNPATRVDHAGGPFRIMHVGGFFGSRQPDLLLEALADIGHTDIEFVQIGGPAAGFERYRNRIAIRVMDRIPQNDALDFMRTASLLYLKQGFEDDVPRYAPIAAKTYEYLATGLPILVEAPAGDNVDLVRQYAAESYIITSSDKSSLREAVVRAYDRRNDVIPTISETFASTFNRRFLTEQLSRVLEESSMQNTKQTNSHASNPRSK
jgi:hypothetical protein